MKGGTGEVIRRPTQNIQPGGVTQTVILLFLADSKIRSSMVNMTLIISAKNYFNLLDYIGTVGVK